MYVGLSKEHEALRDELRAYYDQLLTPEVEEDLRKGEGVGQVSKDTWKKMASDGYATVESNIFAFSPAMSYPSKEFVARDPEFWTPKNEAKSAAPAKKAGAGPKEEAKPADKK